MDDFVQNLRKKKSSLSELYILKLLNEGNLIIKSSLLTNTSIHLLDIKQGVKIIDNVPTPTFINLIKGLSKLPPKQYVNQLNKDVLTQRIKEKFNSEYNFAWYEHVYSLSEDGKKYIQDNPNIFNELERKILDEHNASQNSSNIIVSKLGKINYHGYGNTLRPVFGVGSALIVLRETENRYYVEYADKSIYGENKHFNDFVEGSTGKLYIDKKNVLAENITPEIFLKMSKTTNEYYEYHNNLDKEEEEALKPIRERFENRRKQAMAMYEDELSDALKPEGNNLKI
jgi:hypothetical protein